MEGIYACLTYSIYNCITLPSCQVSENKTKQNMILKNAVIHIVSHPSVCMCVRFLRLSNPCLETMIISVSKFNLSNPIYIKGMKHKGSQHVRVQTR